MDFSKQQLQDMVKQLPFWWHSIDLGNGVITPGAKTSAGLATELESLKLPDLHGKAVLDIGACDGFFSFEAERRGAGRVVANDYYYWRQYCGGLIEGGEPTEGSAPSPTEDLPGKRGFDLAHGVLGSSVETLCDDYMRLDERQIGTFDVVLYLGVFYHMQNPLEALKRLAALTGELAVIETAAIFLPGHEDRAVCEFFETDELNHDASNWWAPNAKALEGLARAAGFRRVTVLGESAPRPVKLGKRDMLATMTAKAMGASLQPSSPAIRRYRAIAHAWK